MNLRIVINYELLGLVNFLRVRGCRDNNFCDRGAFSRLFAPKAASWLRIKRARLVSAIILIAKGRDKPVVFSFGIFGAGQYNLCD